MQVRAANRDILHQAANLVDAARARLGASREHILHIRAMVARSRAVMQISRSLLAPAREPAVVQASVSRPAAPAFDIRRDSLARHHWRGLNAIASSGPAFEPLSRYAGVGPRIADWLMCRGLVESRPEPRPRQPDICYRATALGHQVLERGRRAAAGASESARKPALVR